MVGLAGFNLLLIRFAAVRDREANTRKGHTRVIQSRTRTYSRTQILVISGHVSEKNTADKTYL